MLRGEALYLKLKTEVEHVQFREFAWLLVSLFVSWGSDPDRHPGDEPLNVRTLVGVLVLLLMLIVVGLHIIDVLRHAGALQECVMQGRTNCVPSIR